MSPGTQNDPQQVASPVKDEGSTTAVADRDEQGTVTLDVRPIPAGVAAHMRTLECRPAGEPAALVDVDEFIERADEILDEIVEALCDDLGFDGDVTALGVNEERNSVTGAHGLIRRRLMRRGRYSGPLAEMFSETGLLDDRGRESFEAFRAFAFRHGLDLWIHEVRAGQRRDHTAFAIFKESEHSDDFWYGARLLVTPFEVGQWRSPFLEVGCPRPS